MCSEKKKVFLLLIFILGNQIAHSKDCDSKNMNALLDTKQIASELALVACADICENDVRCVDKIRMILLKEELMDTIKALRSGQNYDQQLTKARFLLGLNKNGMSFSNAKSPKQMAVYKPAAGNNSPFQLKSLIIKPRAGADFYKPQITMVGQFND